MLIVESKEEIDEIKKFAAQYHKEITQILEDVRKEMLLLFKINGFIRNIDRRMGYPLDGYQNMVSAN
jgi:hypothetical protein